MGCGDERAISIGCESRYGGPDVVDVVNGHWHHLESQRRCSGLSRAKQSAMGRHSGVVYETDACRLWRNFLDQLQPFASHRTDEGWETGDVSAGPIHACDQPALDRIAKGCEHDRYRLSFTSHDF